MMSKRAVFEDGSVSFVYTGETEEQIRTKVKQGYFDKSRQDFTLVIAGDEAAILVAKKDAKRRKEEKKQAAADARKAARRASIPIID